MYLLASIVLADYSYFFVLELSLIVGLAIKRASSIDGGVAICFLEYFLYEMLTSF